MSRVEPPPPGIESVERPVERGWVAEAMRRLEAENVRTADTSLFRLPTPPEWNLDVYLKDEASAPTGSLKQRLARSLILYGLVNGWIGPRTTLVEASSGSTAVSEAYFARLIGLPFVAVLPRSTSEEKIRLIERMGGRCHFVDQPAAIYATASELAAECGGHYLDQFTYAERATDWRGNNNVAESIFSQLRAERHPVPEWVVVGAGTGGTSATVGRYVRYRGLTTKVCVVDPEGSAFFPAWRDGDPTVTGSGSRIEGIGRPRVEPSFLPTVVDRMIRVPDAASVAAARWLRAHTQWDAGPSTGTNLIGTLVIVGELHAQGAAGSVVTLLCDRGDRYSSTFASDAWLEAQGLDLEPWRAWLEAMTS